MCVILVCPPAVRPGMDILEACQLSNPHGAGVGWRDRGRVHWMKNLAADEVHQLLAQLEGEVVIHFRWASVGGVDGRLCHPFPVEARASTKLSGTASRLLFHNGTWSDWKRALKHVPGAMLGAGEDPLSDSRAMALLVHHLRDARLLQHVQGRVVLYGSKTTKFFGDWKEWGGMTCSNLGFLYGLERESNPKWRRIPAEPFAGGASQQLALFVGDGAKGGRK